jgi:hypothetical protein
VRGRDDNFVFPFRGGYLAYYLGGNPKFSRARGHLASHGRGHARLKAMSHVENGIHFVPRNISVFLDEREERWCGEEVILLVAYPAAETLNLDLSPTCAVNKGVDLFSV